MTENTWAKDLNPSFQPMNDSQCRLFLMAAMMGKNEQQGPAAEEVDKEFLIRVLNTRIEVLKLPITFSLSGKVAVLALCDRPGYVVALLIDCLNAYEGQEVTASMLADLYPTGFYNEETFARYADDYLKAPNKKVKWAEIY